MSGNEDEGSAHSLHDGDKVDRYVIEGRLGAGGMGEVYRAFDPKLVRRVALKRLREGPMSDEARAEFTARMIREARASAGFDHPNVVTVFDVGASDGLPFIAMELVSGKPLRAYVGDPSVSFARKIRWMMDVARGLAAAHRAGLVHRDVKPENIMVRDDGVVKILDFGIARRANAPVDPLTATDVQGLATITREGMVIGTNGYMSPEQLRAQSLDGRSDQFAWGVTAFELFSGASPWWPAVDTLQVVIAVLTGPTPDLAKSASDLPSGLASIIKRTLAKVADDRFDTLDEVADALANLGEIPTTREQNTAENPVKTRMSPTVAATVLADPRSESERVPTQTPTVERRPKTVRPWHVFAALSGVCVAGWLGWLGLHSLRGQAQQQATIQATPEVPDAQPIPAIALRHLCPPESSGLAGSACPDGTRAWCDHAGVRLACCAPGLVPTGADGICACAPGGVSSNHTVGGCPQSGEYSHTQMREAFRRVVPEVQRCYESSLGDANVLAGDVRLALELTPEGEIFSARIQSSAIASPDLQRCALVAVRRTHFLPPPDGVLSVAYPVSFRQAHDVDAQP